MFKWWALIATKAVFLNFNSDNDDNNDDDGSNDNDDNNDNDDDDITPFSETLMTWSASRT